MKLESIQKGATAMLEHGKFVLHKKSPEIWLVVGITAIVGGTILACRATRKLDQVMDEHEAAMQELEYDRNEDIEELNTTTPDQDDPTAVAERNADVSSIEKNYKRDCAKLTLMTAGSMVKLYAPSAIAMAAGIVMVVNGHRILSQRNAALLAAYTALDDAFSQYRQRVRDRYGEQVEDDIYSGRSYETVPVTEVDENGKKKKVKQQVEVVGTTVSPYARFFDETCREWSRSPDYNHMFIISQQNAANDLLRSRHTDGFHKRGFVFLNEVYKMLGFTESPTGAICGWVVQDGDEIGDNYIDFKIFDGTDPSKRAFVNGDEKSILIDFNVQGPIWDLI